MEFKEIKARIWYCTRLEEAFYHRRSRMVNMWFMASGRRRRRREGYARNQFCQNLPDISPSL